MTTTEPVAPAPTYTPPHLAPELRGHDAATKDARDEAMHAEYERLHAQALAQAQAEAAADPRSYWNRRLRGAITWHDGERWATYASAEGPAWSVFANLTHEAIWWLGLEANLVEEVAVDEHGRPDLWRFMGLAESGVEQGMKAGRIALTDLDAQAKRKADRQRERRASVKVLEAEERETAAAQARWVASRGRVRP